MRRISIEHSLTHTHRQEILLQQGIESWLKVQAQKEKERARERAGARASERACATLKTKKEKRKYNALQKYRRELVSTACELA